MAAKAKQKSTPAIHRADVNLHQSLAQLQNYALCDLVDNQSKFGGL